MTHRIEARIAALPDVTVYLSTYEGGLLAVDSTNAYRGRFHFNIPESIPTALYITFQGYPDHLLTVVTGQGDVRIEGNFNYPEELVVTGTDNNDLLREYRQNMRSREITLRAIDMGLQAYADSTAVTDSAAYTQLIFKRDSLRLSYESARQEFVRSDPSGLISAMIAESSITPAFTLYSIDSLIAELDTAAMADNAFIRRIYSRRDLAAQPSRGQSETQHVSAGF